MEFLTQQSIVRVPADRVNSLILTFKKISFSDSSFGRNFPFSFGQTQCSSRFCSPRQTSLTTSAKCVFYLSGDFTFSLSIIRLRSVVLIWFHLNWWMDTNCFVLGTSIHPPDPNVFLLMDASHYGWWAHLEPMRLSFNGAGRKDQSQLHINMLEIMAIHFALKKAIRSRSLPTIQKWSPISTNKVEHILPTYV